MLAANAGLVCLVLSGLAFAVALLMTFGTLLEYSAPGALYAGLSWLLALVLVNVGIRLRRHAV